MDDKGYRSLRYEKDFNETISITKEKLTKFIRKVQYIINNQDLVRPEYISSFNKKFSLRTKDFQNFKIYSFDEDASFIADHIMDRKFGDDSYDEFSFNIHFSLKEDFTVKKLYDEVFDRIKQLLHVHFYDYYNSAFAMLTNKLEVHDVQGDLNYRQLDWFITDYYKEKKTYGVYFKSNMKYNGPVKLSSLSEKRLNEFEPGDLLFETN